MTTNINLVWDGYTICNMHPFTSALVNVVISNGAHHPNKPEYIQGTFVLENSDRNDNYAHHLQENVQIAILVERYEESSQLYVVHVCSRVQKKLYK